MDKVLHMIGIAKRAGSLEVGDEPVGAVCRAKKCRLLLLASDAADNTVRRAAHFAEAGACLSVTLPYTKAELGGVTGRSVCAMAAVLEIGMADAVARLLREQDEETYGAVADRLAEKAARAAQRRREQQIHEERVRGRGVRKPYVPTRIKREQKQQQK